MSSDFFTPCVLQRKSSFYWLKSLSVVALILLSAYTPAFGADSLGFTVTFSKPDPKPGDTLEIIFKAKIPEGWHLYSEKSDCKDDGPMRSSFIFDGAPGIELIGGVVGVGDSMVKETEIWNCSTGEFSGSCEFRQKIVYKSVTTLVAHFEGQRCNMKTGICLQVLETIPVVFGAVKLDH